MGNANIKSLKDFYQTVRDNGLRVAHEFQIEISDIPGDISTGFDKFIVYAQSASLPGREIQAQPTPYFGFDFQVPVNTKYSQTWALTVRLDKDMQVRKLFEDWFDYISSLKNSTGGKKGLIPSGAYAMVHMLSPEFFNANNPVISRSYRLEGVFPSSLGDVRLEHGSNDIASFETTLMFQYWYPTASGGDTSNGNDPLI